MDITNKIKESLNLKEIADLENIIDISIEDVLDFASVSISREFIVNNHYELLLDFVKTKIVYK